MNYTQCLLVRREEKCRVITVGWIPSKLAKINNAVNIQNLGSFEVEKTYTTLSEYDLLLKRKLSDWIDEDGW